MHKITVDGWLTHSTKHGKLMHLVSKSVDYMKGEFIILSGHSTTEIYQTIYVWAFGQ